MTSDELVYRDRLNVFKYYLENTISIKALCHKFNRSRTWFYRWYARYQAHGEEGLRDIKRAIPAMPNHTSMDIEAVILDFIVRFPTYGPQHVADELTLVGTPRMDGPNFSSTSRPRAPATSWCSATRKELTTANVRRVNRLYSSSRLPRRPEVRSRLRL